jgi:hypothetical protein
MENIVYVFLDYKFDDFKLLLHEQLDEVYYLVRNESFDAVIDKNNKRFYINNKLYNTFTDMFCLSMDEAHTHIKNWVELRFGIKDCSIRNVHRNSW